MKLLSRLFRVPTGFGTAGMRRHAIEGALTVLGSGAPQRGVELAETGGAVVSFRVRYFPQVRDQLLDNLGEIRNWFVSSVASREVTIVLQPTGSTGVMAYTFLAAVTPANDVATFGSPTGGLYMTEAEESQEQAGIRTATVQLRSDPGVT